MQRGRAGGLTSDVPPGLARSRVSVLREIASRYVELVSPLNGPSGIVSDGETLSLTPRTYTATVREFERLARRMRDDRFTALIRDDDGELVRKRNGDRVSVRSLWWHLNEWHVKAEHATKQVPRLQKNGRQIRNADGTLTTRSTLVCRRNPQAEERLAEHGLTWMARHWSLVSEPMLPQEILATAA